MVTGAARVVSGIGRLLAAGILAQTLYFKFTAAPESVYIFSRLGVEPWGRVGTGVLEAVCVLLLLFPKTPALGAALACGLMGGAVFSHITNLGIEVQGDHGLLFKLAMVTLLASLTVLVINRRELPLIGSRL